MKNSKLAIVLLLIVGTLVLGFTFWSTHKEDRAAILALSRTIGRELVSQTNSPHLLFPGNLFQRRLAELLAAPAHVEAVRYGDEPRPSAEGRACSRIYLLNERGSRLALRLKLEGDPAHYRILGWWVPTSPPPPETP
jgi:hypothetical protein